MSNIKDLSRILADKRKLSVADAEKFMSLMIDVINDKNHKKRQVIFNFAIDLFQKKWIF